MPLSPPLFRELVTAYLRRHPGGRAELAELLAALGHEADPGDTVDAGQIDLDRNESPTRPAQGVPLNASAIVHDGLGSNRSHPRDANKPRAWEPADGSIHPVAPPETAVGGGAPSGTVLHVVGLHLHLERDGMVLLGRRHPDSVFAGDTWHALAGHCEAEAATGCLVREAYEVAGLVIDPADVELVHTVHTFGRPGDPPRIQLFFRARRWEGVPELREPEKCVAWEWWSAKDLPEPIVPYTRVAIEGIRAGRAYSELGWGR
ncbi:NUDIX hydrolase [Streptomyces sp. NPDC055055]